MPPEEKQRRLLDWIKILLSFVVGAILTSFTLGAAISKYETTEHVEQTYLRKDLYESDQRGNKDQLNRIESMLRDMQNELKAKEDKKKMVQILPAR